jgi:Restriction endonuclease BglI
MISKYREDQFHTYNGARNHFIQNPDLLINLEYFFVEYIMSAVKINLSEIQCDYDEASYLYPFWQNYPPDDRGRSPVKDQYPWIEVGEHAIGAKLARILERSFHIRDVGLPTGADQRFVLTSDSINATTKEYTKSAWLFIDIKSVGPRDDQDHTVMSHNQVSADGIWTNLESGVKNAVLRAEGTRASHDFHASLPPVFVLSDKTVVPLITVALKPVYQMLQNTTGSRNDGQLLKRIDIACIPNGILLTEQPNYLKIHPGLLFPGKDDKSKDPRKLRARVSFELLRKIAPWRVQSILL